MQEKKLVRKRRITKDQPVRKRRTGTALLFLAPSLIGVAFFVLLPFADAVRRSFFGAMNHKFVGLQNYLAVFENKAFQLAAWNTVRFMGWCIPILLVVSMVLSLLVSAFKDRTGVYKTSFLIPMAIPVASIAMLWKVLFHKSGLLNQLVMYFGGTAVNWMNTQWAFVILVVSYLWKNAGYDMILWLAGLSNISPSLYEAAEVDGAGAFSRFRYITLPGIKPTFYTVSVLSILNSFKVFREAYLIAGDYPHESIYMLQHLFNNWFVTLDIDKLCAAATLLAAAVFLVIMLLQLFLGGRNEQ